MILHCVPHFFIRHGVLHYSVWKVHYFLEVSLFVGVCLFKMYYSLSIISHCLRVPHGLLDLSWFADFTILLHGNIIVYYFCWVVCTFYNVIEDVADVLSFPKHEIRRFSLFSERRKSKPTNIKEQSVTIRIIVAII